MSAMHRRSSQPPHRRTRASARSTSDDERLRRVSRLLRILGLLQSGKAYGLADLAEACHCSTKTIQRDLVYFRELEVEVEYVPERRSYALSGDLPFKLLDLHLFEATSLALAEISVASAQGLSLATSIRTAFEKVHQLLPPDIAASLDASRDALLAPEGAKRDYSRAPLLKILDACRRKVTLSVDYHSMASGRRQRSIEPYQVAFIEGFWFVIARDPDRGEVRNFALDRIHTANPALPERPFRIPAAWDVMEYMAGSVGVLRGERTEIALQFSREAAPWLAGRRWRFAHTLTAPDANGAVTLTGAVAGLDEIAREVLRWGRHVTVLAPVALRERVAEEARAIAAKYPTPSQK